MPIRIAMNPSAPRIATSQRTAYQFPVYRWIGWLAVAGFAIGLTAMFFLAGMFGVPAPLGWATIVILFTLGALLLDRPKMLLGTMLFYFLLMPSNRLFGLLGLPLPTFIDELFFLPFIAVIAMNWIQRRQLREATVFPVVFVILAGLSWYVNRPGVFTAVRVTLIVLKSYILWYYCRLTCTFESERQLNRWMWGYVIYAAVQFFYNVLWQQGPWPKFHPDRSGGVFGPGGTGGAHVVGYLSVFALMIVAGWWVGAGGRVRRSRRIWAWLVVLTIAYNLIFMTDTKHALVLFPLAFLPFIFHPKFSMRLRMGLLTTGLAFIVASIAYIQFALGGQRIHSYLDRFQSTPKGKMVYAVTVDFGHLVPYPLLGAGPGQFASVQAVDARAPLARRYVIPYLDEQRRLSYFSSSLAGTVSASSIMGMPQSDMLALTSEYGWLGAAAYYGFIGWMIVRLWRKSTSLPLDTLPAGYFMSLSCGLLFFMFTTLLISSATMPVLAFPLWILIGRMWDMKPDAVRAGTRAP